MSQAIQSPERTACSIIEHADFGRAEQTGRPQGFVEFMRRHPTSEMVGEAAQRIAELLAVEFPGEQYECSISLSELGSHLLTGVREGKPVVLVFTREDQADRAAWSWTIHFVEVAGVGARIHDVVASIRTPRDGTWRAGSDLKGPLQIPPFGRATHQWSCLIGPWGGSRVTLTVLGSYGEKGQLLAIHSQPQWPE
jgi:hypothetical protein